MTGAGDRMTDDGEIAASVREEKQVEEGNRIPEKRNPIPLQEAQERILAHIKPRETVVKGLMDAAGYVIAEDIRAPFSQPPFRRSAMDGYAVRSEDCAALADMSAERRGVCLKVAGEIDAGDTRILTCGPGQAWRIMTGARVPDGADRVIPQEYTDFGESEVCISRMDARDNVAPVGEDFLEGDVLVHAGEVLDAFRITGIAAAGITDVSVYRRPKVALISTGNELRQPGEPLEEGQIYDSSSRYFETRLRQTGCEITARRQLRDDAELIAEAVKQACAAADLVITTGGVSVGNKDYLAHVMRSLGAEILFHGVEIKPGMPTLASVLDGTPVLSLSGNPYSASALFEYLFPYSEKLYLSEKTAVDYPRRRKVRQIVRGRLTEDGVQLDLHSRNGTTKVPFHANCLAEIPAGSEPVPAGTRVRVLVIR